MEHTERYNEFSVKISDMDFMFFVDEGFFSEDGCSDQFHSHKFNEMIFAYKGNVDISINDEVLTVRENDMVIIPPDEKHLMSAEKNSRVVVISFWSESKRFDKIELFKKFKGEAAFSRLLDYYYNKYEYKKELMYSCFVEIAALISEKSEQDSGEGLDEITLENDYYRKYIIDNYFLINYNKTPNLAQLSKKLNLSTVQTHRILKKVYGKSFCKIIISLRMEQAKRLLVQTDLSANEISEGIGYSVAHNFYAAFKENVGMTPIQYRRMSMLKKQPL